MTAELLLRRRQVRRLALGAFMTSDVGAVEIQGVRLVPEEIARKTQGDPVAVLKRAVENIRPRETCVESTVESPSIVGTASCRIDGESATGAPLGVAFTAAGFVAGPKRLTLRARR